MTRAPAYNSKLTRIAPLRLTRELSPQLVEGAKIAHITSRMGSIADNTSGSMYGYRMSKAALNAAGKSMAVDLAPKGIAVAILHPGFVRTGMTGGNGLIDAPESAAGLLARIDELTLETSGTFLAHERRNSALVITLKAHLDRHLRMVPVRLPHMLREFTADSSAHEVKLTDDWLQGRTAYGGLTTALCLESALQKHPQLPPIRSAQVSFVGPAIGLLKVSVRC